MDIEKFLKDWPYETIQDKLEDCFHNGDTPQEAFALIADSPELTIMAMSAIYSVSPKEAQEMYSELSAEEN